MTSTRCKLRWFDCWHSCGVSRPACRIHSLYAKQATAILSAQAPEMHPTAAVTHQVNSIRLSVRLQQRIQPPELQAAAVEAMQQHHRRPVLCDCAQLLLLHLTRPHESSSERRDRQRGNRHCCALHACCHGLCCWLCDLCQLLRHESGRMLQLSLSLQESLQQRAAGVSGQQQEDLQAAATAQVCQCCE